MENIFYRMSAPSRTRPSSKPMRVLCLGLSRSGTDSLRAALQILGYDAVYHGFVITATQRADCAFWVPLMQRKLHSTSNGQGALADIDFDSVLGPCEAVTDGPANIFGEELMSYYPEAKVILNRRRDMEAWYQSMRRSCLQVFSWPMWTLSWFDTSIWWLWLNFDLVMRGYYRGDFERWGKEEAAQHYRRLEEHMKKEKRDWLDWSVQDGWAPLCAYLGSPVPDVPFPDGNKGGGQFEQNMEAATKDLVQNALKNMAITIAVLLAGAGLMVGKGYVR